MTDLKMPPQFIYPSAGEAEAVMHPSADTEVVDFRYRRDDGDLVTLDQVREAVRAVLDEEHSVMRLHGEPGIDVDRMTDDIRERLETLLAGR